MLAKSLFPSAQVFLSDLDHALSLAFENSQIHAVDGFVRGDLLSWCGLHASISLLLTRRMLR